MTRLLVWVSCYLGKSAIIRIIITVIALNSPSICFESLKYCLLIDLHSRDRPVPILVSDKFPFGTVFQTNLSTDPSVEEVSTGAKR